MFIEHSPIQILRTHKKAILGFGVLVALLSLGVSLLFPLEYRADAQVLVIAKSRSGVDPYTIAKSGERIGEDLIQVVKTNDFYTKVMADPNFTVDRTRFEAIGMSEQTKRKNWQNSVSASVVYGTSVLSVSAYSPNASDAAQLSGAIVDTLAAHGWEYVGGDVSMKIVNQPIVTRWPVRPNLIVNVLSGFAIGVLTFGLLVVYRPNKTRVI